MAEKQKGKTSKAKSAKKASGKSAKRTVRKVVSTGKSKVSKKKDLDEDLMLDEDDDLPPEGIASIDAESVAEEVERAEAKGHEENGDDVPVPLPARDPQPAWLGSAVPHPCRGAGRSQSRSFPRSGPVPAGRAA